jgi:hypothetical protein
MLALWFSKLISAALEEKKVRDLPQISACVSRLKMAYIPVNTSTNRQDTIWYIFF